MRAFTYENGRFYLNEEPVYLRGGFWEGTIMNGEISTVIIFVTIIATVHKFIDIICDKCPKK